MHIHDYYQAVLLFGGCALHIVNCEANITRRGAFMLIRPSDVHKLEFFSRFELDAVIISISVASFRRACEMLEIDPMLFWTAQQPPCVTLGEEALALMEKRFTALLADGVRMSVLSELPAILYPFAAGVQSVSADEKMPQWLSALLSDMDEPENFAAGLPFMLSRVSFTQEHFTREFRRFVKLTPTEYINIKRMNYAGELLLSRSVSLNEIASRCGLKSLCYFYHVFKEHFDMTPKQFIARFA